MIKTEKEIALIREGGRILRETLLNIKANILPGVKLKSLDLIAWKVIKEAGGGAYPAFLGYKPSGAEKPYPASICASVNEVVVHGVPNNYELKEGDIVSIDVGVKYKGFYTDGAMTFPVGKISKEAEKLMETTKEALSLGIKEAQVGKTIGDIGFAIEKCAKKNGVFVVKMLTGHGVGKRLHEPPTIFNFGRKGSGEKLLPGMTLAIEPMFALGTGDIKQTEDESYATIDGSLAAHFEHTILITEKKPEILTL